MNAGNWKCILFYFWTGEEKNKMKTICYKVDICENKVKLLVAYFTITAIPYHTYLGNE